MRTLLRALQWSALGASLMAGPVVAHGPTPQKVEETIEIAAPPEAVWAIIKNFDAMANWHPLVASSAGRGGNEPGSERDVVLKSGGQLTDGLDDYRDSEMSYAYRLAKESVEVMPVSFYSATLEVKPAANGGSAVEWIGRFYRADTGNFPPPEKSDEAATKAMTEFFRAGLDGLKQKAETQ